MLSKPPFYKRGPWGWIPDLANENMGCPGKAEFQINNKYSSNILLENKVKVLVAQWCLTLCNPMDCSPPHSSVHGIFQARSLEWVAITSSRGPCRPRNQTWISCIADRVFIIWAIREEALIRGIYFILDPWWGLTMWLREQLSSGKGKQTRVASILNGTYKTRSGEEMMKGQSCLGCQDLLIFFLVSTAVFKRYFWVTSTEVLTAIILHYLSQVFFFWFLLPLNSWNLLYILFIFHWLFLILSCL